ncbi:MULTISPECIES: MerR family transcriptional regulator [unclassified Rhodococcus (in: high G+C Gram-positive bacteria)]|uniref:MerR family transcriptional regulator n=1 Tax=unclassified Rhodococcus (in: high G+C Gram-positive bacteria) TaxID=192944 RepID=UPI0016397826|nr:MULTISPECIES: MerR family transcriptional regulator [unclassified Rhodococcus (in: high G+C Gram-positive bacteria)]MBC2639420.1 MerR family transcriptional regulator [Rhodococcus sp. 3A]MBC2895835.1 MerR family transcriptional regulator [Rhodococcus sp. 4CII]
MRVSELVARTGVPLATVKYYLREGLLMPGEATSATQARYGEEHIQRLGLVKALAGAGLPIPRIREILRLVDHPDGSLFEVLGQAIAQLPPYLDGAAGDGDVDEFPRARAVLERLGQVYDPRYVAVGQLERALEGLEEAGIPMTDDRLEAYGRHVRGIAEIDIGLMPTESAEDAIRYAVLGTAIYEPVIAAMRRLAHQDVAQKRLRNSEEQDPQ